MAVAKKLCRCVVIDVIARCVARFALQIKKQMESDKTSTKKFLSLISPTTLSKRKIKRRRPDRDTVPYTTGWVYDVLGVDSSTKKKLFKVCFMRTLFIVYSFHDLAILY